MFGFEGTILDSSMVEHAAVNRGVVGSSPTRGAITLGEVFSSLVSSLSGHLARFFRA